VIPIKVLALDIENTPPVVHAWGLFNQNIGVDMIIKPSRVFCFAASWESTKSTVDFYSENEMTHKKMVKKAWDLLDEADVLTGYNSKHFDYRHLNREFDEAGLGPASPVLHIDLLTVARQNFLHISNKLKYILDHLGMAGKEETGGIELWTRCMAGDQAAWSKMEIYNKRDVSAMWDLYQRWQPWVKNHPNRALVDGVVDGCTACGGTSLQRRGFKYTGVSAYQRYRCNGCGAWLTDTKRIDGSTLKAA